MAYLFAAYLVLWAIVFGYLFSIHARQKRLSQEIERLRARREGESSSPKEQC